MNERLGIFVARILAAHAPTKGCGPTVQENTEVLSDSWMALHEKVSLRGSLPLASNKFAYVTNAYMRAATGGRPHLAEPS